MKRTLSHTASIIGLALGLTASTAFSQTTAPGPYYATPSWDQTLPIEHAVHCAVEHEQRGGARSRNRAVYGQRSHRGTLGEKGMEICYQVVCVTFEQGRSS